MKSKITVIGIGPGNAGDMTTGAIEALRWQISLSATNIIFRSSPRS